MEVASSRGNPLPLHTAMANQFRLVMWKESSRYIQPAGVHLKTKKTLPGEAFLVLAGDEIPKFGGAICICSIVPRDPNTLPPNRGLVRDRDVVAETQIFKGGRFGVHIYLARDGFPPERLLQPPKKPLACTLSLETYKVIAVLDQPPGSFTEPWPSVHSVVFSPALGHRIPTGGP